MGKPASINAQHSDLFAREAVDRHADPVEARKKAMDYLARREYGRQELVEKLVRAGFDREVCTAEVSRLVGDGLQDDRRFADAYVRSRLSQGKGPVRIALELGERGLDEGLIGDVIDAADTDWFALAAAVRQKKFGSIPAPDFAGKAKQMRFLQYRGFEQAHIQAAMKEPVEDD